RVSQSIESSETAVLDAGEPAGSFRLIEPRTPKMRYHVNHHSGTFYIVTNADGATNFKVMTAPAATPGRENWQTLIDHRPDIKIDDIDLFRSHLVVYQREQGLKRIRVTHLERGDTHLVDFPDPVYT